MSDTFAVELVVLVGPSNEDPAGGSDGLQSMLDSDGDTGKAVSSDYINATVGFEELGKATGTPPKSLMRMFSPRGNPQAKESFCGDRASPAHVLRLDKGTSRALRSMLEVDLSACL